MARNKRKHKKKSARRDGYMLGDLNFGCLSLSGNQPADLTKLQKPFRLNDLPDELILRILEYAVVSSNIDGPIRVDHALAKLATIRSCDSDHGRCDFCLECWLKERETAAANSTGYRTEALPLVPPAITRSTRKLRHEGLKLFYSENFFFTTSSLADLDNLAIWLQNMDPLHIDNMSEMIVTWVMTSPPHMWEEGDTTGERLVRDEAEYWCGDLNGGHPRSFPTDVFLRFDGDRWELRERKVPWPELEEFTFGCHGVKFGSMAPAARGRWVDVKDLANGTVKALEETDKF